MQRMQPTLALPERLLQARGRVLGQSTSLQVHMQADRQAGFKAMHGWMGR